MTPMKNLIPRTLLLYPTGFQMLPEKGFGLLKAGESPRRNIFGNLEIQIYVCIYSYTVYSLYIYIYIHIDYIKCKQLSHYHYTG